VQGSELALEELKMVHEVIARQERTRTLVRNWLVTLQAGLAIAYLSDQIAFSGLAYGFIASLSGLMFLLLEAVYSAAERQARQRGFEVEDYLRSLSGYDGPRVIDTLVPAARAADSNVWTGVRTMLSQMATPRILVGYAVLAVLVIVVALAGS
jgi:hypothetical protein